MSALSKLVLRKPPQVSVMYIQMPPDKRTFRVAVCSRDLVSSVQIIPYKHSGAFGSVSVTEEAQSSKTTDIFS